jgi:benzoyl-CoA reductase/2-hydroxyglutaryl-CoA dehydratase subunit BcrC/BadD/HgdB
MMTVAYASPLIPPEWIAAHQLRPLWLPGLTGMDGATPSAHRGVCRCAELLVTKSRWQAGAEALVMTTTCDQLRYAAAYLHENGTRPVFLFNVPSTWQHAQVRQLYRQELIRLGRFLESLGGRAPSPECLLRTMQRYDEARATVRLHWLPMCDGHYAKRLAALRDGGVCPTPGLGAADRTNAVHLALVGGPLLAEDFSFLQLVAAAGGRIVLDASEWGERTLPAPLDQKRLVDDPIGEMTRVYFEEIPAVFRRPNTRLYDWLEVQIELRGVRGILFWRRVFCDLWHAELDTMRHRSSIPVLDIDVAEGDGHATARTLGRLEAFLEMLP